MPVKVTIDRVDEVLRSVSALTKRQVVVGIPAEFAAREAKDGDKINNAELLYIHEMGAPAANIPARPTLIPGIKAYRPRAIERLKKAGQAAMAAAGQRDSGAPRDVSQVPPIVRAGLGDRDPEKAVMDQLNAIGLEAVVSVKNQFTDGGLLPLKPATIAARKRAGFEGESPLIRTADLMRHINYAIRKTK